MTRSVISVPAEASVVQAGELMVRHDISGLPVVDANGHLVGMLTERDFLRPDGITVDTRRPRWFEVLAGRSNPPAGPAALPGAKSCRREDHKSCDGLRGYTAR